MNEFQVIDSLMPDTPTPSAGQLAAARARVFAAAPIPPASRARVRRRSWTGMALVAAAVALVVGAVTVLVPRPAVQPVAVTPMQKLEAAAARLAATPEAKGRFWRRDTEEVMRTKTEYNYKAEIRAMEVEERAMEVLAFGPSREVYGWREPVSSKPYTAKGLKAWRRDGSPKLCPARGCDKNMPAYSSTDLKLGLELAEGLKPTMTELRNLPKEPAALRARLLASYDPQGAAEREPWLAGAVKRLINSPATPGTRAAAYLLLAKAPGIKVVDEVPGTFGLNGLALQYQGGQLVIDPRTGQLLGIQGLSPEGVAWEAEIIRKAGWSDVRPVAPPKCRSCTARL
ncbi:MULTISPECIES: CU044_5270 family protein [unclassified Nonomuraea]|uniref:CU044_5270 family protein n=1 Tax=unclassified Nonomuraea TaxID=2593643 RepID=UPI0033ECD00D